LAISLRYHYRSTMISNYEKHKIMLDISYTYVYNGRYSVDMY